MDYSYLYKLTYKPTGEYYIGSRTNKHLNKPAEEDFMIDYFTGAPEVTRKLIYTNINDWEWELTPMPREQAIAEEKRLLNETADDPLCLYKHSKKRRGKLSEWAQAAQTPEAREKKRQKIKAQMTPERRAHLRQKGLEQAERQKNIWTDERRAIWRERSRKYWEERRRNKS